jgi:polyphosphate glucokinase
MTPDKMVKAVRNLIPGWNYDAVSLGYPGVVDENGPALEPKNLGEGWVGFDFAAAFGKPVRIINDAAMQALGSYEGGRMLFLGLGTGVGSAVVADRVILPLELGILHYKDGKTLEEWLNKEARKKIGQERWEEAVAGVVRMLKEAFAVDYVMLGGGNAKKVREVPPGARRGGNENARIGGFRLWNLDLPMVKRLDLPRFRRKRRRGEWRVV